MLNMCEEILKPNINYCSELAFCRPQTCMRLDTNYEHNKSVWVLVSVENENELGKINATRMHGQYICIGCSRRYMEPTINTVFLAFIAERVEIFFSVLAYLNV